MCPGQLVRQRFRGLSTDVYGKLDGPQPTRHGRS
jgi:hypothetical protein